MIDLSKYIGKFCLVQLRAPDSWLMAHADNGKPEILAAKSKDGQVNMIPVPILVGNVVAVRPEKDTNKSEYIAIEFLDENKQRLLVELNPDAILSVTTVPEPPLLKIVGG